MTYALKSCLLAAVLAGACAPTMVFAQSSTTPGTQTDNPAADCDVSTDPNCKPNLNQKERTDDPTNTNPEGALNNPSSPAQDPAAENTNQTPGAIGSPESATGNNSLNPAGSEGSVGGDNAGGGPGSAGSDTKN
jgi:hypothetical protein